MAEPAGLALGTVALATLVSTCIELFQYFELHRTREYDYHQACLKLSLLKARLFAGGETLWMSQHGHEAGREKDPDAYDKDIVRSSLLGIANILGNAATLKGKYHLSPKKSRHIVSGPSFASRDPLVNDRQDRSTSRYSRFALFRQSTNWVIRDKQKFDSLIADLEFFISNLEIVVSRLRMAPQTSERTSKEGRLGGDTSYQRRADEKSLVHLDRKHSQQSQHSEGHSSARSSDHPSASNTEDRSSAFSHSSEGYTWSVDRMEDNSAAFHGMVGGAKLAPAPKGQTAAFRVGTMTGNSRVIGGAMNDANFNDFVNGSNR